MSKQRKDELPQVTQLEQEAADDPLLTPLQVSKLFAVAHSTAWRWAATGKIPSIRTPGGPRKIRLSDVKRVLGEVAETGPMIPKKSPIMG